MEKIILYREERSDIKIYMDMYFNNEGQLIFEGQDIGKSVEVEKLYTLFGINNFDKHSLLIEIKKRFEGNMAYSKFGEFMENNNIKFTVSTWT